MILVKFCDTQIRHCFPTGWLFVQGEGFMLNVPCTALFPDWWSALSEQINKWNKHCMINLPFCYCHFLLEVTEIWFGGSAVPLPCPILPGRSFLGAPLPTWSFPSLEGGLLLACSSVSWEMESPVNRRTDTTENITFPRTMCGISKSGKWLSEATFDFRVLLEKQD